MKLNPEVAAVEGGTNVNVSCQWERRGYAEHCATALYTLAAHSDTIVNARNTLALSL